MCNAGSDEIVTDQKGVFRTNCLDWCAPSILLTLHMLDSVQFGSYEFCARYIISDLVRTISWPRSQGMDSIEYLVVVPS